MLTRSRTLSAVHAFVRPPNHRSIPSTGPNGVVVNREMLLHQFREFYRTLQQSSIIDKLHVMSERPIFESMRAADQLVCIGSSYLGMPLVGNEHRASEFMETMRYVRGAGGPSTVSTFLQDTENCRCHSGDLVLLPQGLAVGHGPRTNMVAQQTIQQLYEIKDPTAPFHVVTLEQEGDAPPLGDYFGFAGRNTLVVWKDEHGMLAADQYQTQVKERIAAGLMQPGEELQVVYLEQGCHFLSFFGTDYTPDILVQKGFDRSVEALSAVGLNPIPVQWTEMDKMGVSMRSAVLMMNFLKLQVGGMLTRNPSKGRGSRWQGHQLK